MPDLTFTIDGAEAVPFAASPVISLSLRVRNEPRGEPIDGATLRCQVQIEPARRAYGDAERAGLDELFGEPERWPTTVRPILWAHVALTITAFTGETVAPLHVPCTYDLLTASAKYLHALADGDVPIAVLFSGTVFHREGGALRIAPVPWTREARFRLPIARLRETMDHYYPNAAGVMLRRDVFDRLDRYRARHALTRCDDAIERLLAASEGGE